MIYRIFIGLVLICFSGKVVGQSEYSVNLYDANRKRVIPVTVYQPQKVGKHTPVIIFNHGYGQNDPDSYKAYSSLTIPLAMKGYYVISIQHELPDDPPLAMTGDFMETRMSSWETGVENILFTIAEFKKLNAGLNWKKLAIVGHSNGGDMAMLLATKYSEVMHKAISLDHRRMKMPRCNRPKLYTLRGSDYEVDKNVIPSITEQQKYDITVVKLDGIKHGDMDNKGTKEQHDRMLLYIYGFLKD